MSAYACRSHAQSGVNEGSTLDARPFSESENSSISESGSIAESTKFDGAGATTQKFEGVKSPSKNNKNIKQQGFGV
jgi:hypothetical protein